MAGDDGRAKFMDDLAGMAGGAFSVLSGIRTEAEQMAKSQAEAMVRRLDLVKREELDAAMEVARRAREQAEALEDRVAALEARLAVLEAGPAGSPES
jgi:BMFP domain-containing protein YqiC